MDAMPDVNLYYVVLLKSNRYSNKYIFSFEAQSKSLQPLIPSIAKHISHITYLDFLAGGCDVPDGAESPPLYESETTDSDPSLSFSCLTALADWSLVSNGGPRFSSPKSV